MYIPRYLNHTEYPEAIKLSPGTLSVLSYPSPLVDGYNAISQLMGDSSWNGGKYQGTYSIVTTNAHRKLL